MINRLIELSAKYRFVVFLVVAAATVAGVWSMRTIPIDAIPDLSDTQVIVYSRWDRSPDIIEDQVTYPIVTAMLGAPKVKAVRGFSDFGFSYVYIVFDEGTDIYWARSRTLEYLSSVLPRLPQGVRTELGPDATGVGWVFQYALVDTTGRHGLDELRSYQDWNLQYYLKAVPGVAEVAPIGGFVRQYQVQVDPNRLRTFNIPIGKVLEAVRAGNNDVGGRLVEMTGAEYMVRGRGYAKTTADIGEIVLARNDDGVPVHVRDVGEVSLGPDLRRGIADLNGTGDVVAGIIVMRQGENALAVIDRVYHSYTPYCTCVITPDMFSSAVARSLMPCSCSVLADTTLTWLGTSLVGTSIRVAVVLSLATSTTSTDVTMPATVSVRSTERDCVVSDTVRVAGVKPSLATATSNVPGPRLSKV